MSITFSVFPSYNLFFFCCLFLYKSFTGADKFESSSSSDLGSRLLLFENLIRFALSLSALPVGDIDLALLNSRSPLSLLLEEAILSGGGSFQAAALAVSNNLEE